MEHALRNSPVPVLAVPLGGPADSDVTAPLILPGPVVAPVDFSPASVAASRIARGIASALGVPLVLMHVVAQMAAAAVTVPGEADRDEARDPSPAVLMADLALSLAGVVPVEPLIRRGSRGTEIAALALQRRVSVIVMSLKGEGAPVGLRKPGVIAYDVMRLAPVPVLAVPPGVSHAFAGHRAHSGERADRATDAAL
jgi:hypothetical protein